MLVLSQIYSTQENHVWPQVKEPAMILRKEGLDKLPPLEEPGMIISIPCYCIRMALQLNCI